MRYSHLHNIPHCPTLSTAKMPSRPELQKRIERMRKKIENRTSNLVVVNEEASVVIEALKHANINGGDDVCRIKVFIGNCCGVVVSKDCKIVSRCYNAIDPHHSFGFCSAEHRETFENNAPQGIVETFYELVATINLFCPDLHPRFYTEWLPCAHIIIARQLEKELAIASIDDDEHKAYANTLTDPFVKGKEFLDFIFDDIKRYRAFQVVSESCVNASENAVCLKDHPEPGCQSGNVYLLSPSGSTPTTPRSAQESPRHIYISNSPRSANNSPRQPSGLQEKSS